MVQGHPPRLVVLRDYLRSLTDTVLTGPLLDPLLAWQGLTSSGVALNGGESAPSVGDEDARLCSAPARLRGVTILWVAEPAWAERW